MNSGNIIAGGVVLFLVLHRLNKKGGTSTEIKRQVSKRYMEFVVVFELLHFFVNKQQRP
jgi:hypothetical protein